MVSLTTPAPAAADDPAFGESAGVELGPFDFWPDAASRIEGLGGPNPPPDPGYVFHTPYLPCPAGPVLFRLVFVGLEADAGTLTLQVNEMGDSPEAYAQVTEVKPVRLRTLARRGTASVAIEAQPGHSYALFGRLSDGAEARATDLSIAVVEGHEPEGARGVAPTAAFRAVGAAPLLSSITPPSLRRPASQLSTAAQRREAEWDRLAENGRDWPEVYALRCLEVAELLSPEACLLLIGDAAGALSPWLAGHGCDIAAAADGVEPLSGPLSSGCDAALWLDVDARSGDPLDAVEGALGALHPGGLGVFVWRYAAEPTPGAITRAQLERLAIVLLSHQHDVAQLKFHGDPLKPARKRLWRRGSAAEIDPFEWFGLLVRRGPD